MVEFVMLSTSDESSFFPLCAVVIQPAKVLEIVARLTSVVEHKQLIKRGEEEKRTAHESMDHRIAQ